MNLIDKTIEYFNPRWAAKREVERAGLAAVRRVVNSGYSESGASRVKKSMRGWTANSRTPMEDIDFNLNVLRQRSRDLFMSSPLANSAIKTNRTNVVGSGLRLKSRIDFDFLGMTSEQADAWEMNTEREFNVWADSVWCDSLRLNNFYELQQIALISWLMNGEGFALIKNADPKPWMPYGLRIYLIEADRVCNPNSISGDLMPITTADNGNRIINGVEIDDDGAVVAYHICNHYPNSFIDFKLWEWVRVEAFGALTGQPNILHLMENERCEQYRGVPYLAPVIEALKQITRYTEAELMAAVVTAFFTAFIKSERPTTEALFGDSIESEQKVETDPNAYELGAGTINVLAPGEDVVIADPKRPASGFDAFVSAMTKYIGASLEVPYELLTKSFTASYSASRAALLEAWKAFKMRRTWFANDFCQPVYELWLAEAVARGRIKAPGFFNDPAIRKAWCRADWNGPAPGQLDPVKEVQAATLRVGQGFSTREKETIELTGGDWDRNITQIKRENELLTQAGIPVNQNVQIPEGGNNNNG
ncbi:MAG: phage portal protein [Clostridiales bacterium]|nr:phage portal protein [Eubacteriales bacterium]MDH7566867.1 phage portal protein [Clostridiales bacterium]